MYDASKCGNVTRRS